MRPIATAESVARYSIGGRRWTREAWRQAGGMGSQQAGDREAVTQRETLESWLVYGLETGKPGGWIGDGRRRGSMAGKPGGPCLPMRVYARLNTKRVPSVHFCSTGGSWSALPDNF